jgi:hypothetical protein
MQEEMKDDITSNEHTEPLSELLFKDIKNENKRRVTHLLQSS